MLLGAFAARAETAAVYVAESSGVAEAQVRRVAKTAEVALKELSGFTVEENVAAAKKARRCGDDAACLAQLAGNVDHALFLALRGSGGKLSLDAWLVDVDDKRAAHRTLEGSLDEPEAATKSLVEATLPAYARKGWGGLMLSASGAQVKIDGRRVRNLGGEVLAVPAAVHSVDVLYPQGDAVLERVAVPEGSRLRLDLSPRPDPAQVTAMGGSASGLRLLSYGLWTVGMACIGASFVEGASSRRAAADLGTCQGASRTCLPYDAAVQAQAQAEGYARTANVLLGTGAALSLAGAGVFTFDLVSERKE